MNARKPVTLLGFVALLSALFLGSCVDGPVAGPTTEGTPSTLVFVPQLTYAVASGAPALSAATEDALSAAFDRVNRFRLIVKSAGCIEVLLDVILEVTPGQDVYDLAVEVPGIAPGEPVCVVIIAMEGETTLFESPPIMVATTDTQTATPPQPLSIPLTYTGPGADAVRVEILSEGAVLAPGGTRTFEVEVSGSDGSVMADVPLGWAVASPAVASVTDAGTVTGGGGGRTLVTVTTPTGLSASVWVYVFGGEMTFIQGGMVMTGPVVGGTPQAIAGTGGAHGPVPTGSGVMYGEGGMVYISGVAIMAGSWPAPSPDGTKIAVDGVVLANADGSGATEGPAGSQPAWASATSLYVSGGSIELVDVVSGSRSLVISGAASFPTVTAGGRLAYLDGAGQVFIQGSGPVPGVVTGSRPAISGDWVLYAGGGGLMVAPLDGGSPPMALGVSGTDPAWGGASGGFTPPSPPPPVEITGLDPETPVPGQEAVILGSGFDPIIASNTRVFFPTDGGEVEVEILEITATSIRVLVPRGVAAGEIRVATLTSEDTFPYTPMFGSVAVTAVTPWGTPVAGVGVMLTQGGTEAAAGATDADGSLFLDGILAGDYTAAYTAPDGFSVTNAPPTALTVTTDVLSAEVEATPEVRRITISPETPEVEVGSSVEVMLQPLDINGDVIPQIDAVIWASSSPKLTATGGTLTGTLTGVAPSATPGDALFRVFVNGTGADFFATVTSFIEGTFTLAAAAPAPGEAEAGPAAAPEPIRPIEVELTQGSTVLKRTESDADGHYKFPDLFAGSYTVHPLPRGDYTGFSPSSASVTLDGNNPTGHANFAVGSAAASVEGRVVHAVTGFALSGASVQFKQTGVVVYQTTSAGDGSFAVTEIPAGTYDVLVVLSGFVSVTLLGAEVIAGETTTLESFLLVPVSASTGTISGQVVDGTTGGTISGATVELREGINATTGTPVATTSTDGSGAYSFGGLSAGTYTVSASASGFVSGLRTGVAVGATEVAGQDVVLSPVGGGSEVVRVILTWGAVPTDLDAHLTGPLSGGGRFHVAYFNKGSLDVSPFAKLDRDDTSSFGPETITIVQNLAGVYRHSVHDYSNRSSTTSTVLAQSGAKVEVFRGSVLIRRLFVPNEPGTLWTVFELNGETLTPINIMSYESSPSAITAPGRFGRPLTHADGELIQSAIEQHPKSRRPER